MNQNNYQGIRQVTPEEIAKAEGIPLTHEELQKTQVLNLKEVEDVVRFEKLTSKKPAIIVGVIGALLITFGTTFQITKSLSKAKPEVEKRSVPQEEVIKKEATLSSLTCKKIQVNNPDGTDTEFTIQYNFKDDKLSGFTKTFLVAITPDNPTGAVTVQNYLRDYQAFLNQTEGYTISLEPKDNGLFVTVIVDYETLDLTKVSPTQQTHFSTKIDYPIDTEASTIQLDMLEQSFTCE